MIRLAALEAGSRAEQRTAACDELSRIEYRITNIECRSVESLSEA